MPQRDFICRGPNCWGRGVTPRAAMQAARKHLPTFIKPRPGQACYTIHDCPPGTTVNEMGGLTWTKPGPDAAPLYRAPEVYGHYDINGRVPNGR